MNASPPMPGPTVAVTLAPAAPVVTDAPAETPRPWTVAAWRARRAAAWDHAPVRSKTTLLVLLASVGGLLVGMLESGLDHRVWPMAFGLLVVIFPLLALAWWWVWQPVEGLVAKLDPLARTLSPGVVKLPIERADELGRIARTLHALAIAARRNRHEAAQLRRTLDDRIARATSRATRQLKQLAMRDSLTDLGNRRFLDENLGPLVESVSAADADLLCLVVDMDNFKQINDTLGHAAGDRMLVFLAGLIRATLRSDDYAVRLGGDEFVVLMPNCPLPRARHFAEQLIVLFRQQAITIDAPVRPSLSVGLASLKRDALGTGEALLRKADENLYQAKKTGKGRCVGAG